MLKEYMYHSSLLLLSFCMQLGTVESLYYGQPAIKTNTIFSIFFLHKLNLLNPSIMIDASSNLLTLFCDYFEKIPQLRHTFWGNYLMLICVKSNLKKPKLRIFNRFSSIKYSLIVKHIENVYFIFGLYFFSTTTGMSYPTIEAIPQLLFFLVPWLALIERFYCILLYISSFYRENKVCFYFWLLN